MKVIAWILRILVLLVLVWLALLNNQSVFPALPAKFPEIMITSEKRCGLIKDFGAESTEGDHLTVALRASGFHKAERDFAGTLAGVLRGAFGR